VYRLSSLVSCAPYLNPSVPCSESITRTYTHKDDVCVVHLVYITEDDALVHSGLMSFLREVGPRMEEALQQNETEDIFRDESLSIGPRSRDQGRECHQ
jgi:hypothetical protein